MPSLYRDEVNFLGRYTIKTTNTTAKKMCIKVTELVVYSNINKKILSPSV